MEHAMSRAPGSIRSTVVPRRSEATGEAPLVRVGGGTHAAFEASLEFFLSPLLPLLRDPEVTEIMVNGADRIYVERSGKIELTAARFASEADVQAAANNV